MRTYATCRAAKTRQRWVRVRYTINSDTNLCFPVLYESQPIAFQSIAVHTPILVVDIEASLLEDLLQHLYVVIARSCHEPLVWRASSPGRVSRHISTHCCLRLRMSCSSGIKEAREESRWRGRTSVKTVVGDKMLITDERLRHIGAHSHLRGGGRIRTCSL